MPKPTLLQSLLGRPSQSYRFPAERDYYSAKSELFIAAGVGNIQERGPLADGYSYTYTYQKGSSSSPSNGEIRQPVSSPQKTRITSDNSSDSTGSDNDDDDLFYTPLSSPPTSMFIPPTEELPPPLHPSDDKASSSSSSSSSSSHSALSCSTPPTSDELHASLAAILAPSHKRPLTPSRSKRISPPPKSYTYTDEDWAREIRWLVKPSTDSISASKRRASLSALHPAAIPRPRPRTMIHRRHTTRRMTALLEEDEDPTDDHRRVSTASSHTRGHRPPSRSSVIAGPSNSNDFRPISQASHSHSRPISLSSRVVDLPQFPTTAAPPPAPGYTTLSLPRASYRPEDWRTLGGGHVDLPRDGRAQLSMVSMEVVRGVASASFLPSSFRRRNSAPRSHQKKHDLGGALALTSHGPPPSFVPNSDVLIHVHAVGLEGLDRQIILDRLSASEAGGKSAIGFIPGRSVLGRVVECGLEVSRDTLKKGEWVIGLLDAKKCGALSEFVLLDRHRVYSAPQPSVPMLVPAPITSSPSTSAPSFSFESLALLPPLGVPAYRAVRTYTASKFPLPSGSGTALVLRGQDGAGGFATLMLRAIGVNVIVQVDPLVVGLDPSTVSEPQMLFSPEDDRALGTSAPRKLLEVCARLRAWGVEGICIGAPLDVLHTLNVDVDFVLDTIGGGEIWQAARILLACGTPSRGPAQFTTIVGDNSSGKAVPTAQDHWRAGVRSLKRAMTISRGSSLSIGRSRGKIRGKLSIMPNSNTLAAAAATTAATFSRSSNRISTATATMPAAATATRTVGYSWVSCTADVDFEGCDVRDALAALLDMPALERTPPDALLGLGGEYGAGRVLPFERTAELLSGALLEGGGTAVVRIVS